MMEIKMGNGRYEIVGTYISHEKYMFIVKLEQGTHVMPEEDWKWIFGQLRPERWKDSVRVKNVEKEFENRKMCGFVVV